MARPTTAAAVDADAPQLAVASAAVGRGELSLELEAADAAQVGALAAMPTHCDLDAIADAGGSTHAAARACAADEQIERDVGAHGFVSRAKQLQAQARLLHRAGQIDEAREAYAEAIAADHDLDDPVPATALARNHLALIERDEGNADGATEHLRWVIDHTTDPSAQGAAWHNLALVQLDAGDLPAARTSAEQALRAIEASLGSEHAATATCRHTLGVIAAEAGALDEAHAALSTALASRRVALGEAHPLTAETHTSLGVLYGRRGQWHDALREHEAALAIDREVLGESHATTAVDLAYVGEAWHSLGEPAMARPFFEQAAAILSAQRPADDPELARLRAWLGE